VGSRPGRSRGGEGIEEGETHPPRGGVEGGVGGTKLFLGGKKRERGG